MSAVSWNHLRFKKRKNEVSFSAEYFKTLHAALGFRLVKALLESLAPDGKGFSSSHVQSIVDLASQKLIGKRNFIALWP